MFRFDKSKDIVMVTGATGFLGKHLVKELKSQGYSVVTYGYNQKADIRMDLKEKPNIFRTKHRFVAPKAVINLAASVGGIGANQKNPATFMYDSLKMGMNVVENCLHSKSMQEGGKLVQIGTVCSYPKFTTVPFQENDIWNGYPEETNAPYGIAKKAIMELIRAYNTQYSDRFNGITIVPTNLYGPGDNFNLDSSHVIPAVIRKIDNAIKSQSPTVTFWGTGQASREFLFVKDASKGIIKLMENYEGSDPVNLGVGKEIKIIELVEVIAEKMGYKGEFKFDASKPDGQPRRCLDISRAKKYGFEATTSFSDGLDETINWWYKNG